MTTMPSTTWREERRRDRMAEAQISREGEAARTQADIAQAEARARLKRDEALARAADRKTARKQRAARWAARMAWLRAHMTDLLFVPVIAVPGALAWSAMAVYGYAIFGPAGFALPAFSEGAMWVFEVRATWTASRHPDRPVWHLQLGSWVFAGIGASLNFLGGLTVLPGHPHGIIVGIVKAVVSAAGLVAHQMVKLGPRRTRAERATARTDRAIARRERTVRRAALKRVSAVLDAAGNARLVHAQGKVTLTRSLGRARLEAAPAAPVWLPWPMLLPGISEPAAVLQLDMQAGEAMAAYRGWHSEFMANPASAVQGLRESVAIMPPRVHPAPVIPAVRNAPAIAPQVHPERTPVSAPRVHPSPAIAGAPEAAPKATRKRTPQSATDAGAERHYASLLAAGKLPSVRRIKSDLHVGQTRAEAIREHLARKAAGSRVVPLAERRRA